LFVVKEEFIIIVINFLFLLLYAPVKCTFMDIDGEWRSLAFSNPSPSVTYEEVDENWRVRKYSKH
jgi:hypothetical protein